MGSDDSMMLSGKKLKTLAKLVHQQEVNRIRSVPFKSELDRGKYMHDSKEAYQSAVTLVDDAKQLQDKVASKPTTAELAQHYLHYVEYGVNSAIRTVWNLYLRDDYLKKIRAHADTLVPQIKDIYDRFEWGEDDPVQLEAEARELIKKLAAYKNTQYQYMLKWKNPASRNFSHALKKSGETFERMVEKYRLKLVREKGLQYDRPFEELDYAKRIEVYDEIAKSSGRGSLLTNTAAKVFDAAGKAVLLIAVGMMAWDIYTSEHKLQTGAVEGAELIASVAGGFAGEFAGAAAGAAVAATAVGAETAAMMAAAVGVEVAAVTSAFVCLTAVVTGFGAAIALGVFAGWLVSKIFETGGKHASKVVTVQDQKGTPPPPKTVPPTSMQNIAVYVAPMPDGNLLARQLAYQGGTA